MTFNGYTCTSRNPQIARLSGLQILSDLQIKFIAPANEL